MGVAWVADVGEGVNGVNMWCLKYNRVSLQMVFACASMGVCGVRCV